MICRAKRGGVAGCTPDDGGWLLSLWLLVLAQVLGDSFTALARMSGRRLSEVPLYVSFVGEEGIDQGGVTKEWLTLVMQQARAQGACSCSALPCPALPCGRPRPSSLQWSLPPQGLVPCVPWPRSTHDQNTSIARPGGARAHAHVPGGQCCQ